MKITQNAIIKVIGPVLYETFGNKMQDKQQLILLVPGYVNQFGERQGKDEYWEYTLTGKLVKEIDLAKNFKPDDKITVEGYLNSQSYQVETAKPYSYKIRLATIKLFSK